MEFEGAFTTFIVRGNQRQIRRALLSGRRGASLRQFGELDSPGPQGLPEVQRRQAAMFVAAGTRIPEERGRN